MALTRAMHLTCAFGEARWGEGEWVGRREGGRKEHEMALAAHPIKVLLSSHPHLLTRPSRQHPSAVANGVPAL